MSDKNEKLEIINDLLKVSMGPHTDSFRTDIKENYISLSVKRETADEEIARIYEDQNGEFYLQCEDPFTEILLTQILFLIKVKIDSEKERSGF